MSSHRHQVTLTTWMILAMLGAAVSSSCTRRDVQRVEARRDPRKQQITPIPPSESSHEIPGSTSSPAPVEPQPGQEGQIPVNDGEFEDVLDDLDQALQELLFLLGADAGFDVAVP